MARSTKAIAIALRSPAVISMSISRPGRLLDTWLARCSSSSVSLPMADTTTTTSTPSAIARVSPSRIALSAGTTTAATIIPIAA